MTSSSDNPASRLNEVLSEVIDLVQEVKEAHRKVSSSHALHAELDLLFDDVRSWAQLLLEEEETLGLSPLDGMPSVAGRKPANPWPGPVTDQEVRVLLGEHLERLAAHVSAAMVPQHPDGGSAALAEMQNGLLDHRQRLGVES